MTDEEEREILPVDVVITGLDLSFDDLFGIAFKATVAILLALLMIVIIIGVPAVLIYQGVT
jgi:hypothetical protein